MSEKTGTEQEYRTHQPISRVHRRLGAAFLTALLTSTALTWPVGPAQADCGPPTGPDVVCDAPGDTDGFETAAALDSFTVLSGVVVNNFDGTPFLGVVDIWAVTGNVLNQGTVRDDRDSVAGFYIDGTIGGSFENSNTGTISGTTGVWLAGWVNGFNNAGIITGTSGNGADDGTGDGLYRTFSIDVGFSNQSTGIITGDDNGVWASEINGDFTNAGTIEGKNLRGVRVYEIDGAFTNTGTIKGGTDGIYVHYDVTGDFTNAWRIEGANGHGVNLNNGGNALINRAGATITGTGANRHGVHITGDMDSITNAGTITGTSVGVNMDALLQNDFNNTGMITGGDVGVFVKGINGQFINSGTITGTGGTAIQFGSGSETLTLVPGFTINGNVLGGGGTDTLRFGGTDAQNEDFNLDAIGSGGQQYQSFETFEVTGGTWTFNGATTVDFTVTGGMVKGTGTFGGLNVTGGMFAPGNSIGTMTVSALTLGPGGTLQIEVNEAGQSDLIIVNGGVTISGATLQVVEEPGTYSGGPFTYTIIENDGTDAVVGTFGTVTNNFAFLTPAVDYAGGDGNDVVLTLTRNTVAFTDVTSTANQGGTAGALQGGFQANATTGSDNLTVINAITGLSAHNAKSAFDSVSGEIHASVANVLLSQGGLIAGTVGNRLAGLRAGEGSIRPVESPMALAALSFNPKEASEAMLLGMAHDDGSLKDAGSKSFMPDDLRYEAWGRAWGSTGTFDADGNAAETDGEGAGLMAGGDVALWQGARFGLAGGYSSTETNVDARGSRLDADSATVLAYLTHVSGAWHAHVIGGYTHHDFDGRRNITVGALNRTAASDYDGHQVTVTAEIGYTHEVDGIALQPIAAVRYGSLKTDAFTETGAGSLDLVSSGDTHQATDTILGVRMSTVWRTEHCIVVPQARVAWTHTFGEVTPDLAMAFAGGGAFTVAGVTRGRDALALGAGLNAVMGETTTAYIDYAASLSDDQDAHALSGGVRVRF